MRLWQHPMQRSLRPARLPPRRTRTIAWYRSAGGGSRPFRRLQALVEAGQVCRAEDLRDDVVAAVEEEGGGESLQTELGGDLAARVEDAGVAPADLTVEAGRTRLRVLDVDADHLRLGVRTLKAGQRACLRTAARAPRGPHVDDDELAGERGKADRLAGDRVGATEPERRPA